LKCDLYDLIFGLLKAAEAIVLSKLLEFP
jgi:hypothetical protein